MIQYLSIITSILIAFYVIINLFLRKKNTQEDEKMIISNEILEMEKRRLEIIKEQDQVIKLIAQLEATRTNYYALYMYELKGYDDESVFEINQLVEQQAVHIANEEYELAGEIQKQIDKLYKNEFKDEIDEYRKNNKKDS